MLPMPGTKSLWWLPCCSPILGLFMMASMEKELVHLLLFIEFCLAMGPDGGGDCLHVGGLSSSMVLLRRFLSGGWWPPLLVAGIAVVVVVMRDVVVSGEGALPIRDEDDGLWVTNIQDNDLMISLVSVEIDLLSQLLVKTFPSLTYYTPSRCTRKEAAISSILCCRLLLQQLWWKVKCNFSLSSSLLFLSPSFYRWAWWWEWWHIHTLTVFSVDMRRGETVSADLCVVHGGGEGEFVCVLPFKRYQIVWREEGKEERGRSKWEESINFSSLTKSFIELVSFIVSNTVTFICSHASCSENNG